MSLGVEVFNGASGASVSSKTIPLDTSGADRIIVLGVHTCSQAGGVRLSVSSVADTNGLTWNHKYTFDFSSANVDVTQRTEVWWAYAHAQQVANTVTVTLSGSARGVNLAIGAISGVSAGRWTDPWDSDVSLPQTAQNPSGTSSDQQYTFSTHDSHDVGIAFFGSAISGDDPPAPTGWTKQVDESVNNGGIAFMMLQLYTKIFSAQQSGTVVDFGNARNCGFIGVAAGGDPVFPFQQVTCAGF